MPTLREEAEFLALALAMGLVEKAEVIAWADGHIVDMDVPPIEIIDVSLAGGMQPKEVVPLLKRVRGTGDLTAVAHQVLGLLRRRLLCGAVTPPQADAALSAYLSVAEVPSVEWLAILDRHNYVAEPGDTWTDVSPNGGTADFLDRHAVDPNDPNRQEAA